MATVYTDTPHNWCELKRHVITDKRAIVEGILGKKCFFYDACSFRRHANLSEEAAKYFLEHVKGQDGIIVITRCILMELASCSGMINPEYIQYVENIAKLGIGVLVIYEEDIFSVMDMCFATNATINSYLVWAVRMLHNPVSTITEVLDKEPDLYNELIKGNNLEKRDIYSKFFMAVRNSKESGDNLGEELLAICLHILSHIPGEEDGKFCVITDDKGAAGRIDNLFRNTRRQYEGRKIGIFSTPKLVQIMYQEKRLMELDDMREILSTGTDGNIVVLGTLFLDLHAHDISMEVNGLVGLIMRPNGINIIF